MPDDTITSLIVVLVTSTKDVENQGKIITFGPGANLSTVRTLAAEKLGISSGVPLEDIILRAPSGRILEGINDIRDQQVIHVDLQEHIKETIPGPSKLPFVGSLYSLMPNQTEGWLRMFRTYGPLINMNLLGTEVIATWDPRIAEVFCKESEYFTKKINLGLKEVKLFAGQGLFTTDTSDEDWKLAHKLLMPAFSPRAIKAYLHEMGVIAIETIKTLEQYKPDQRVEILDWTTRLTFETIGRTGFGYHFKLLGDVEHCEPHPFIEAMGYCLRKTLVRSQQAEFYKKLPTESNKRFERSIKLMNGIVDDVIAERKKSPEATDKDKDLLGFMLNARDEHGLGLSDENIRNQVITFLIAGHDTTANTLAWCLYELSRHPEIEQRILQEIANVGITHTEIPTTEQISQLKYVHQVIKETLRKYPPVRALTKYCTKDCIVYGGYRVPKNTVCQVSTYSMHHNPDVYENPEVFDPERFTPEEEQKRSRFAWLPFSTGPRSCIGMAFALQEAKVVLSMFLHRFKFCYEGPDITFNSTVATTKPEELYMTIHPRTDFPEPTKDGSTPAVSSPPKRTADLPDTESMAKHIASQEESTELPNATFLFGTQTGTAQDYAAQLASQARAFGFKNVKLLDMDDWDVLQTGKYEPKKSGPDDLLVVVTATYNGQPPDHAEKFSKFITTKTEQKGNEKIMDKLNYAVFGVGNKNWRTYQAFPRKVSNGLCDLGANQFFPNGEGNADADIDADFNEWSAHFWMHTLSFYGLNVPENQSMVPSASVSVTVEKEPIHVNFISPSDETKWKAAQYNRNGDYNAQILLNRELQQPGSGRSTRHIELNISSLTPLCENGQLYTAGDHLEVYPENDPKTVQAVALNFGWVLDSVFEIDPESIKDVAPRSLAATIKGPCTVENALRHYADLTSPPSRTMLSIFSEQLSKASPQTADRFRQLIMPDSADYPGFIEKNRTLLELQKNYPQVNQIELSQFLMTVGVMQPRRYSIASSPLPYPNHAHLTVGVVHDVLKDGREFYGLASSYLARASSDKQYIRASLKSAKSSFNPPDDPTVPIIMIAAGTGLSPFRGFIQERAYLQEKENKKVGETVLFFGCRRADQDFIYSDELNDYKEKDVLTGLHVAFSRQGDPVKYVQHQLLANATEVYRLLDGTNGKKPASIYVCGAGTMSRDVRRTFCNMVKSFGTATTVEEAEAFIQTLLDTGRYNEDVWG